MRKIIFVISEYKDLYDDEGEALATFTENEEKGLLNYVGDLVTSDERSLKQIFEVDVQKSVLFEMEPKLSNGKLKIEYVDQ
ncbi:MULTISPECIES: hypothetical protein [Bacillus]|uniref:hypothetical protein n=1 Tax=Bacillus TaxID=1386 RepID=UPI0022813CCD|nr:MULTISPECIES: hypothetical protein [Bacillus]MCY8180866.1 hypothetical protein [Bacillus paralicheniformis]MCY8664853.1 hypothetical protein [Bacillus haynesii]MCY8712441.1 hypothetical protein [Bacillus haynesii]